MPMTFDFTVCFVLNECVVVFSVIKVDDYSRRLWDIYTTVKQEGIAQVYTCIAGSLLGLFYEISFY